MVLLFKNRGVYIVFLPVVSKIVEEHVDNKFADHP